MQSPTVLNFEKEKAIAHHLPKLNLKEENPNGNDMDNRN